MRRTATSVFAALVLGSGLLTVVPTVAASAAPGGTDRIQAFTGKLTQGQLTQLRDLGLDHEDIALGAASGDKIAVEVVMSGSQAAALQAKGVPLAAKVVKQARKLAAANQVYRPTAAPATSARRSSLRPPPTRASPSRRHRAVAEGRPDHRDPGDQGRGQAEDTEQPTVGGLPGHAARP